jgi:glutathione synthase
MSLGVAFQMDPVAFLNHAGDSTIRLGREATRRGFDIYYYTPDMLTYREGTVTARGWKIQFPDNDDEYFKLGEEFHEPLHDMDVVLLRQDPPFNMTYLSTTYLLEQLMPDTLVVNNPVAVRNFPEKIFPTLFEHFMPPTLISADVRAIADFRKDFKDIVIKPLYGFGGKAVLRIKPDDENFDSLMEINFSTSKEPIMVQQFLPEVKTEDRRIVLLDGEVAGVVGRIPAENNIRANFRVGGTGVKVELTNRQHEICAELGEILREEGIFFAGIDVIGDYLTEINITSPTGLAIINKLYNTCLEQIFWDAVVEQLA